MTSAVALQAQTNETLKAGVADLRKGTCTAIDWPNGVAKVVLPGSELWLPMTAVPPILNERCWVGFFGTQPIILGPVPRPPYSSVAGTPAAGIVTVLGDDNVRRDVTYETDAGLVPSARVLVDWTGAGQILGLPQADPNTGEPLNVPSVIPSGGAKSMVFNAVSSATWADGVYGHGWKGGDLWDSDHNRGAWFYQGIEATIPDNAVDGHLTIHIPPGNGYGAAPSIGAHGLSGTSGNLSITGRKNIPSGGGDIDISEFFDAFKTGGVLGIGTGGGGNWRFPAAGQYNSGAISASWRT